MHVGQRRTRLLMIFIITTHTHTHTSKRRRKRMRRWKRFNLAVTFWYDVRTSLLRSPWEPKCGSGVYGISSLCGVLPLPRRMLFVHRLGGANLSSGRRRVVNRPILYSRSTDTMCPSRCRFGFLTQRFDGEITWVFTVRIVEWIFHTRGP